MIKTSIIEGTNKLGMTAIFLAIIGWSSAGIFIKLLPNIDAIFIVAIRLSISLFVTLILLLLLKKNFTKYIKHLFEIKTWAFGLILFFCYFLGTLAFQIAPVGEVTILMTLSPLFIIIFNLILGYGVKKIEIIGVIIALFGIVFITFEQMSYQDNSLSNRLLGNIFALIVSILFAVYALLYNTFDKKDKSPNIISVTLSTFIIGTILLIVLITINTETDITFQNNINILFLIGIAVIATAIPTISYSIASKQLKPIVTTSLLLLEPFIAILLAFLIISEIPSLFIVPGLIFILIGLLLIMKR